MTEREVALRGLRGLHNTVRNLCDALTDISNDLAFEIDNLNPTPSRRAEIVERLALLRSLAGAGDGPSVILFPEPERRLAERARGPVAGAADDADNERGGRRKLSLCG